MLSYHDRKCKNENVIEEVKKTMNVQKWDIVRLQGHFIFNKSKPFLYFYKAELTYKGLEGHTLYWTLQFFSVWRCRAGFVNVHLLNEQALPVSGRVGVHAGGFDSKISNSLPCSFFPKSKEKNYSNSQEQDFQFPRRLINTQLKSHMLIKLSVKQALLKYISNLQH